jgi:cyclopropane fatty-acyl-phospholipid synthase-like methyltransferase
VSSTVASAGTPASRADIVRYFERCEIDYRLLWDLDQSLAMHIGCWDASTRTLRDALRRQNEMMAERARVGAADRVLDAGCGVGGSSLFLAERYGCRVAGITLSRRQAATARAHARRRGLEGRVAFSAMDYLSTGFPAASFDVVWACESICYAPSKRRFVEEARRLLRAGGRLIVADGFASTDRYPAADARLVERCLGRWAVPGLDTVAALARACRDVGFARVRTEDVSAMILPSTRRLRRHALWAAPFGAAAEWLGIRDRVQSGNMRAARYPDVLVRRGLIRYALLYADIDAADVLRPSPASSARAAASS